MSGSYDRRLYEAIQGARIRCLVCNKTMAARGWFLHELRSGHHRVMRGQLLLFRSQSNQGNA